MAKNRKSEDSADSKQPSRKRRTRRRSARPPGGFSHLSPLHLQIEGTLRELVLLDGAIVKWAYNGRRKRTAALLLDRVKSMNRDLVSPKYDTDAMSLDAISLRFHSLSALLAQWQRCLEAPKGQALPIPSNTQHVAYVRRRLTERGLLDLDPRLGEIKEIAKWTSKLMNQLIEHEKSIRATKRQPDDPTPVTLSYVMDAWEVVDELLLDIGLGRTSRWREAVLAYPPASYLKMLADTHAHLPMVADGAFQMFPISKDTPGVLKSIRSLKSIAKNLDAWIRIQPEQPEYTYIIWTRDEKRPDRMLLGDHNGIVGSVTVGSAVWALLSALINSRRTNQVTFVSYDDLSRAVDAALDAYRGSEVDPSTLLRDRDLVPDDCAHPAEGVCPDPDHTFSASQIRRDPRSSRATTIARYSGRKEEDLVKQFGAILRSVRPEGEGRLEEWRNSWIHRDKRSGTYSVSYQPPDR